MKKVEHPQQPLENVSGIIRFKSNLIVRYLLDVCRERRIADMNSLSLMPFPVEDRKQFAQLIGYSLGGYGELPYVSEKDAEAAYQKAEKSLSTRKKGKKKGNKP